jgi:hypothetical protein
VPLVGPDTALTTRHVRRNGKHPYRYWVLSMRAGETPKGQPKGGLPQFLLSHWYQKSHFCTSPWRILQNQPSAPPELVDVHGLSGAADDLLGLSIAP